MTSQEIIIEVKTNDLTIINFNSVYELLEYYNYNNIIWLKFENIEFTRKIYFPKSLQHLIVFRCVYCDNWFRRLPNSIVYVKITNSRIVNISKLFCKSQILLETINLSYNRLIYIKDVFPSNIKYIDLSNNNIVLLPDKMCFSKNIDILNLNNNCLKHLPVWFLDLKDETIVRLMGNNFWFVNYLTNNNVNEKIDANIIKIATRYFGIDLSQELKYIKSKQDIETNMNIDKQIENKNIQKYNLYTFRRVKSVSPEDTYINIRDYPDKVYSDKNIKIIISNIGIILNNNECINKNYIKDMWIWYIFDGCNILKNIHFMKQVEYEILNNSVTMYYYKTYNEILESIWSISLNHKKKRKIRDNLRNEIISGIEMSFTEKINKIINSLYGFIENIQMLSNDNE